MRSWLVALVVLSCSVSATGLAQDARPPEGLRDPTYRRNLELANRSMQGPGWEIAGGAVLMTAGPVIGLGYAIASAFSDIFDVGCTFGDDDDLENRRTCEQRAERRRRKRIITASTISISLTFGGAALLGHGVYNVRHIRLARRELGLEYARLGLQPGGAELSLGVSF